MFGFYVAIVERRNNTSTFYVTVLEHVSPRGDIYGIIVRGVYANELVLMLICRVVCEEKSMKHCESSQHIHAHL